MIIETALICLALNIYHEARGEPVIGQVAVAHVTMNRAKANKSSTCQEVYANMQFSWTHEIPTERHTHITETRAWKRALNVAKRVYDGDVIDPTNGATHYHTDKIAPVWIRDTTRMIPVRQVGSHKFYHEVNYGGYQRATFIVPVPPKPSTFKMAKKLSLDSKKKIQRKSLIYTMLKFIRRMS